MPSQGRTAADNLAELPARLGLHGHTHIPVAWIDQDGRAALWPASDGTALALEGRRALLNPGSVGQPRDGDPAASYAILDPDADTMTWYRVRYDVAAVQAAMREVGLPIRLIDRLAHGR